MGLKTRATFEEALQDAGKYVGANPNILALPKAFKLASVHLMMDETLWKTSENMRSQDNKNASRFAPGSIFAWAGRIIPGK